jgi:cell division protein FtsZ
MERDTMSANAVIKVIGVGGAGGNAINTMIRSGLTGVEFIAANTDLQALQANLAPIKIQLGRELTKGLGAGANPDVGRDAALEDKAIIQEVLTGADMVFIAGGMGGGTGTGSAPIIAQVAREMGALTVGVVTKPFSFEGKRRRNFGEQGIQSLRNAVDTLITIPNQRLLSIAPASMSMLDGFKLADEVLLNAVKGISDIINIRGEMNVDFADVRTTMSEMGMALMGTGIATGPNRAQEAARAAINSPLLEDIDIEGATGILINITGPSTMTMHEFSEASTLIQEAAHEDANIIVGFVMDDTLGDNMRVTVIATGFDRASVDHPAAHHNAPAPHTLQPQMQPQGHFGYGVNPHDSMRAAPQPQSQRPMYGNYGEPMRPPQPTMQRPEPTMPTARPVARPAMPSPLSQTPVDQMGEQGRDLIRRAQTPQPQMQRSEPLMRSMVETAPVPQAQPQPAQRTSEYEDLAVLTMDLASNSPADIPAFERSVMGASAHEDLMMMGDDPEADVALSIARDLAGVSMDDTYETPAFLRRREDSMRNS